jgi:hypothetical protein
MPTTVFACGFECAVNFATNGHWDLSGGGSFSTGTVRTGNRSLRVNPSGSALFPLHKALTFTTTWVIGCAIRFTTLPAADCDLLVSNEAGFPGLYYQQSDSTLRPGYNGGSPTFGADGATITTGVWYWIDLRVVNSANPWTIDLKVTDNAGAVTTMTQLTRAVAAGGAATFDFGNGNVSATFDMFVDDVVISRTTGDYPLTDSYVNHFVPVSDGTHTFTTTNGVRGTTAAPTGGGNIAGSTDSYLWIDGVPMLGGAAGNTRLWNQQTASSAQYGECVIGPAPGVSTPTVAPYGVDVQFADREASTATCNFIAKINDNGTEANVVARGTVAGVTSDRYASAHFADPPSAASVWNVNNDGSNGDFRDLRIRWGYSSDATPDVYNRGCMVEAVFLTPAAAGGQPFIKRFGGVRFAAASGTGVW